MVIGQFELGARTQHAVRFDAPNHPFAEDDLLGRNCGARRGKHRFHAGPRIRRTADDLHWGGPSGIDKTNPQPVGIRVGLRLDDAGDDEILEGLSPVIDLLDLKTGFGQCGDDFVESGIGLKMILEPGKREFHCGPKKRQATA